MVYGRIVTPPIRFGANVKSVDDAAAKTKVPGFIKAVVVEDPDQDDDGLGRRGRQDLWRGDHGGRIC